ncbi:MAG: pectinesterase family protein [bacterium]
MIKVVLKKYLQLLVLLPLLVFGSTGERAHIIVAQDGSGHYRSIQDALNSIPASNASPIIILIKNGLYQEKLFIQKSYVTLVGESRDSTRIVFPELRKNWIAAQNGSDWGSATVNIDSTVTDLILANLTIHNNYGSLHNTAEHQFAIRGEGTRIIILACTVIADGGDTVSLWDKETGMYYHADCSFEGWVDYVCPRGWCYITDSKFFGHNLSASLWHDGGYDKDQKFVIRYSSFDGVPNFPLGRHHRDGQTYLLDCIFSRSMADRQIYLPVSPNARTWKWGERHYYYNCHREGGDYDWFRDNLSTAEGSPKESDITAKWTFAGKWDPEGTMPAVLPYVFQPKPRDGSYRIPAENSLLQWVATRNAVSHNVYFGKSTNPEFQGNQQQTVFNTGILESKTTYYWRVNEITEKDTLSGPLWHFTTQ